MFLWKIFAQAKEVRGRAGRRYLRELSYLSLLKICIALYLYINYWIIIRRSDAPSARPQLYFIITTVANVSLTFTLELG